MSWNIATAKKIDPHGPLYATETGYNDAATSQTPIPAAVKARYTLRMLFEHCSAAVRRTYIYQLLDEEINTDSFGLIDAAPRDVDRVPDRALD